MGMYPFNFWELTRAEFIIKRDGYLKKLRRERNENTIIAWRTANFTRCKKMPDLKEVLIDENEKPKVAKEAMTGRQIMDKCRILTAALGGKITEV